MDWFSHYASLLFILLIVTSLFLWEEKKKRWIKPLWLSFFAAMIITYVIKLFVARARPNDLVQFIWLTKFVDYSFPSLHAASAFAPVAILDREFPKLKWFWLSFAVLVAFSRLYFGVHYLSDVVAGAFIGYFVGNLFVSRMKKRKR
jgi:undecaprenyl-diphosphatase